MGEEASMRLVRAMRFGPPGVLVVGEAADPVVGPGEALVRVAVADTLHLDTVIRRGAFPFPVVLAPYVPGGGIAGEVVATGAGVDGALVGRRVVARTGAPAAAGGETVGELAARDSHTGGYAEYAVVPAGALVPVPVGVPLAEAAALVNDGMTAMLLVEAAAPRAGEWVLVTPAGGGVGSLLVQLARRAGARVIGAAGDGRKLRLAAGLGAEVTVDYGRDGWVDRILDLTGGRGADLVLDGVGGALGRRCLELTAPGGRFLGYGAPSGEFTRLGAGTSAGTRTGSSADDRAGSVRSLLALTVAAGDERRLTERALAEAAAGRIAPTIGLTLPLERAAEAHAAIEARQVVGKTLLLV